MYKISVPVLINNGRFEQDYPAVLAELKRAGADRVFLCPSRCIAPEPVKARELAILSEYIPKLAAEGFETGIWISSLGHGGRLAHESEAASERCANMEGLRGHVPEDSFCPLDGRFRALFCDWVGRLAQTGAGMIMLDDDYRLAFRGGDVFCCCDLHLRELETRLGEPVAREGLYDRIFGGSPNRLRDIWLALQRDTLLDFAQALRQAVDRSNPSVRLGHCAVLSTWDLDGADSIELSRAFAGGTKPFLRLIGASYWAASGSFGGIRMGGVIEYERLQQHWCEDTGIELFSECDCYPRPRYKVPSAYVEGLDTAMRASGGMSGALKYMIDYTSSPLYERGYIDRHVKNRLLCAEIDRRFGGKTAAGLRIFEPMRTLAASQQPGDLYDRCIPASLRFAADLCVPVCHQDTGLPVILFGDSAAHADPELYKNGAILDIAAAKILSDRGMDVGVAAFGEAAAPHYEYYPDEDERVNLSGGCYTAVKLRPAARVLSVLQGAIETPGSFFYENGGGLRFLVYTFTAQTSARADGLFRSYCRQRQLFSCVSLLCGKNLPAVCPGHPDLYTLVKTGDGRLAAGFWNFFADEALQPVVLLDKPYSRAEAFNCACMLQGDRVVLSDIPPYSFAGLELFE